MKRVYAFLLLFSGIAIGFLCGAIIPNAYTEQLRYNYDQIVGQVGETTITRGDLAERALLTEKQKTTLGASLLTGELQDYALIEEAARRAGVTITADEIAQRVKETRTFAELTMARNTYEKISPELLQADLRRMILIEKMTGITVTDDEAREYWRSNPGMFTMPAMAKLVCIETTDKNKALTAVKRIRAEEDPRKLSEFYSTSADLKKQRGDIGWRVRTLLSPDVASAIFDANDGAGLHPGECTDVLTVRMPDPEKENISKILYYVFYVEDINQQQLRKFDEVRAAALYGMRAVKFGKVREQWFKQEGATLGKEWKQVQDLRDPQSALVPTPVDAKKYEKIINEMVSPNITE